MTANLHNRYKSQVIYVIYGLPTGAEVAQFHGTMDVIKHLQEEIQECEDQLYCARNDNRKCVRCLERAHVLGRVFEEEEVANGLRLITPWVVERRRQEHGCSS